MHASSTMRCFIEAFRHRCRFLRNLVSFIDGPSGWGLSEFDQLPEGIRQVITCHESRHPEQIRHRRCVLAKIRGYEEMGITSDVLLHILQRDRRFLHSRYRIQPYLSSHTVDSINRIRDNLQVLETFGFKQHKWWRLLIHAPWTFRVDRSQLEATLVYFHQVLRLPRQGVANLCLRDPRVATLHLEKSVFPCVDYFTRELQMSRQRFVEMIEKYPRLMVLPLDGRIKPIIRYFLDELQVPNEPFVYHLRSYPGVLGTSLEKSVRFRVDWIQRVTNAEDRVVPFVVMRGLVLFETRSETLFENHEVLLEACESDASLAARILRRAPHLLAFPPRELRQQLSYIKGRLGRDVIELYHFPSLLGYSFRKRVLPRVELMERLGIPHRRYPLFQLFWPQDEAFNRWIKEQDGRVGYSEKERERLMMEEVTHFEEEPLILAYRKRDTDESVDNAEAIADHDDVNATSPQTASSSEI